MSAYDVPEIGLVLNKNFTAIKQYVAISVSTQCTKTNAYRCNYTLELFNDPFFQMVPTNPDFSS